MAERRSTALNAFAVLVCVAGLASCASPDGGRVLPGLPTHGPVVEPNVARSIFGYVRSDPTKVPLPAATVFVREAQVGALTDRFGRYELRPLEPGHYTVVAQRIGAATDTFQVTVKQDPVRVDFSLRNMCIPTGDCLTTDRGFVGCC